MSYEEEIRDVRIVGVSIPFWDKVWLLVGFAIASIPALVILGWIGFMFWNFLVLMGG
jgi:hypothetical protein